MLGPSIDEENQIEEVEIGEAMAHFLTIKWKVLFAFIPPCNYW